MQFAVLLIKTGTSHTIVYSYTPLRCIASNENTPWYIYVKNAMMKVFDCINWEVSIAAKFMDGISKKAYWFTIEIGQELRAGCLFKVVH